MSKLDLPVRAFVESFCKQCFPNRDFSRGSAINDLVIKAFAAILQPLRHEIDTIKINSSVSSWQVMSREALDALAANWGKHRKSGSRATGQVRLYFETAIDYQINYLEFYSTDGVTYVLAAPVNVSSLELLKNKRGDGTYVYDVTVVSVGIGNKYAATAGSVVGMNNPPQGIIRCENVEDFAVTAPDESNFDVVNSMYRNLGLRNLVSRQSIRAPLYEQFPGILDINITTSSDEKMIRDRLTVNVGGVPTEIRLGGMSDIWVNTTGVVARQVQFSYTPSTQKFKLVSAQQAAKSELLYSAPRVYLTLEGEYAAPDFLAAIYELDESCQVVFDQGGLSSTSMVATPQYQHRYTLATRDLVLGDSLIVFPSRYTGHNRYVTDVLGIPFDTVQAQAGDLAIVDGVAHRATQVSPRVMELAPGATSETAIPYCFTYAETTPAAAGSRSITHPFTRAKLLDGATGGGTIFDPGSKFFPGMRMTIVGSGAAGQYRLIDWSDEDGDTSAGLGAATYPAKKFFLGNIIAEGALINPVAVGLNTQYTLTAVGGGTGYLPIEADTTCWAYCHAGNDIGVFDPRDGVSGVGDWLPIVAIERSASSILITVSGTTAKNTHVSFVQGLKGDLVNGTPIYFENDGTAGRAASVTPAFANCNTRYTNLTSIQIDPGASTFTSPGLGAVAAAGDLLVFEALSLDGTMISLAGNTGDVQWTTPIAAVINDDTVTLGLTPPTTIYAGTAFSLVRNTEIVEVVSGTLTTTMAPADTTVHMAGMGSVQVGDRVKFDVLQELAIGTNAKTQGSSAITTSGVFTHPGIGDLLAVGDIVKVLEGPMTGYTATMTVRLSENSIQLSPGPASTVGNNWLYSATRPGTFLQCVVNAITDSTHVVVTPPPRQTIPGTDIGPGTAVTVTRDNLALASVFVSKASEASLSATLTSLVPSGQSWPLGLGDGAGLPLRITNPRTGQVTFRTVRFSTGGAVRKLELKSPSSVIPLIMSAASYVPAQDSDIGQTVSQKLARTSVTSGVLAAPLPGTWILPATGIQAATRVGDIVEFTVTGVVYSAKIASYPDADHAQLDGAPTTLLTSGAIAVGGSVTTAGLFTNAGIVALSAANDVFEFAIVGVPYEGVVNTLSAPDTIQFLTPYPTYAIPPGTVFKHFRPTTPGTSTAWHVWRTETTISFVGTLRNYNNNTYTWYVEPNDPARDIFVADGLSTVVVSNKQETNLIAAVSAAQPFGYVAPALGDIGVVVRQGQYSGVLTGFSGQNWEVKPLSDQDLFDDTEATTFVDYLNTGKVGARGYGHTATAATTSLIHTTGSTAITMEAQFPFNVVALPTNEDADAVVGCAVEVLSRNGRTGFLGDGQKIRIAPFPVLNPDSWSGLNPATEQVLSLQSSSLGTHGVSTAQPYVANTTSSLETVVTHLPNVVQNLKVTPLAPIPAGSTTISFAGSLIGAWGHRGRVLKLNVDGTDYFHTVDHPVDADTVVLVAAEPLLVPISTTSGVTVEVVDGYISPAVRLTVAGVKAYRLVRPPAILEPITLPVVGVQGTESPSTNQFIDGLQDFGKALGGYDPAGLARNAWLALDSGDDASLVAKAVDAVISSTALAINPGDLVYPATGVQYRLIRRPGWLAMEYWAPGTIVDASHLRILKSSLPADWSWTRDHTFGQLGLHIARDTSAAGPSVTDASWELPHCRIASVTDGGTYWTVALDLTHPNGLNFVAGVFQHTTGFQSGWFGLPFRFMVRVLDRMMVRNVRANGIETYNYYNGQKFVLPVVRLLAVEVVDPATQQPIGPANYDLVVSDPGLRYSAREVNKLVLTDQNMHLKPIRVTYLCDATIEAMDNFVNNDDIRVLNCNQVVKRMETIAIDLQLQVKSTRSQSDLVQQLSAYINTLPSTARVAKDGIIQFLYAQGLVTYINMASMRIDGYYYPAENGVPVLYTNVNEVFGSATAAYIAGSISVTLVAE